jgi:hypothetical protein
VTRLQRFSIGLAFSIVGIGFAIWAFQKGCLMGAQPQIIQALIPLAAGFAAWSFYGAAQVKVPQIKASELGVKLMIMATGGFAVWLVTIYILIPRSAALCEKVSAREMFLSAVGEIRNLRGNYGFAITDPEMSQRTLREGPVAVQRLEAIDPKKLNSIDRIHQAGLIAQGHLYLGIAWDMAEQNTKNSSAEASEAIAYAYRALADIDAFKMEGSQPAKRYQPKFTIGMSWIKEERYDEYLYQIVGKAHLLKLKAGENTAPNAKEAFSKVSSAYRRDNGVSSDWLVAWFCMSNPEEKFICA